jgi:ABC-type uncharacterized transport system involved in gliding motility auxiliary subunit
MTPLERFLTDPSFALLITLFIVPTVVLLGVGYDWLRRKGKFTKRHH